MSPLFMRIGRAARAAGMAPGTLRAYDREGLLVPLRDADGERLYTPEMVEAARRIKAQREQRQFPRKATVV